MRSLAILSTAAALTLLGACQRGAKPTMRSEVVTRGAVSELVSATGEVSALVTVSVGSQISGAISRLYVDFNSRVRKGQILAEIDPRLFEAALARADAGLAAARADVERAQVAVADTERTARRTEALAAKNLVATAERDGAEAARDGAVAALHAAEARVLQAQAERDAAATSLTLGRIRSPIDGIVISRSIDVGQTVAASLQSPTLFLIANDLSQMQVLANVDEADVGKVREGLRARFTVDAFPGEVFEGRIREVRQAPNTVQNVVTYAAVIDAPNPERKLRQGMTASVTLVTNQRPDAIRVPNAALRFRPPGEGGEGGKPAGPGRAAAQLTALSAARADDVAPALAGEGGWPSGRRATAYRVAGGQLEKRSVVVGISDGRYTEVLSGLAEGDRVAVADAAAAAQGVKRGPF
jgi:HlyD family secretion protein